MQVILVQAAMPGNEPSEIKEDRDSDSPKKSESQHYKQSQLTTMEVYIFFNSINFILPPNKTWNAGQLISTTLTKGIRKSLVGHWINKHL